MKRFLLYTAALEIAVEKWPLGGPPLPIQLRLSSLLAACRRGLPPRRSSLWLALRLLWHFECSSVRVTRFKYDRDDTLEMLVAKLEAALCSLALACPGQRPGAWNSGPGHYSAE